MCDLHHDMKIKSTEPTVTAHSPPVPLQVAVLDTGVDAAHPAFAGVNLVTKDFTGSKVRL